MAHSCLGLSWFLQDEAAKNISAPSVQDASSLQITPTPFVRFSQQFTSTYLHSWVERGTVRIKCLAEEHNIVSLARARTETARSGN